MNRAVSGTLSVLGSGRPLVGMYVVAARVVQGDVQVLGWCESGDMGRFHVAYDTLEGPADLFVLVVSPTGDLLFTEPVHRCIEGTELRLQVEVPATGISGRETG